MDKKWYIIACILIVITIIGAGYSQRHTITITPRETEDISTLDSMLHSPKQDGTTTEGELLPSETRFPESTAGITENTLYILNTNTKKFHYPTCKSAEKIKAENRAETTADRTQLLDEGYSPCGKCNP